MPNQRGDGANRYRPAYAGSVFAVPGSSSWTIRQQSMALVFQYGSNTSSRRINSDDRLHGDAKSLGLAFTVGQYDLGFTVWSKGNNCAAVDLVRARNRKVDGVLFEIPDHLLSKETSGERRSLDQIEGPKYPGRVNRANRHAPSETARSSPELWRLTSAEPNHFGTPSAHFLAGARSARKVFRRHAKARYDGAH
jgi:hypothetical protein